MVITKLPNSKQSCKGKVKTHNYINRQNQSTILPPRYNGNIVESGFKHHQANWFYLFVLYRYFAGMICGLHKNLVHINFVTFRKRIGQMKGVSKYGSEHSTFSAHFSTLASYVV
jgi:hypothetical protein